MARRSLAVFGALLALVFWPIQAFADSLSQDSYRGSIAALGSDSGSVLGYAQDMPWKLVVTLTGECLSDSADSAEVTVELPHNIKLAVTGPIEKDPNKGDLGSYADGKGTIDATYLDDGKQAIESPESNWASVEGVTVTFGAIAEGERASFALPVKATALNDQTSAEIKITSSAQSHNNKDKKVSAATTELVTFTNAGALTGCSGDDTFHDFVIDDANEQAVKATCHSKGKTYFKCSSCQEELGSPLEDWPEELPHSFERANGTLDTSQKTCSVGGCGAKNPAVDDSGQPKVALSVGSPSVSVSGSGQSLASGGVATVQMAVENTAAYPLRNAKVEVSLPEVLAFAELPDGGDGVSALSTPGCAGVTHGVEGSKLTVGAQYMEANVVETSQADAKIAVTFAVRYKGGSKDAQVKVPIALSADDSAVSSGEAVVTVATSVDPKDCTHEGHWDSGRQVKAPTCTQPGSTEYTCELCGTKKTDNTVPKALGHDFGPNGDAQYCTHLCGTVNPKFESLGHDWDKRTRVIKEATCKERGLSQYYCGYPGCDYAIHNPEPFETTTVPHSYGADGKCIWCGVSQSGTNPGGGGGSTENPGGGGTSGGGGSENPGGGGGSSETPGGGGNQGGGSEIPGGGSSSGGGGTASDDAMIDIELTPTSGDIHIGEPLSMSASFTQVTEGASTGLCHFLLTLTPGLQFVSEPVLSGAQGEVVMDAGRRGVDVAVDGLAQGVAATLTFDVEAVQGAGIKQEVRAFSDLVGDAEDSLMLAYLNVVDGSETPDEPVAGDAEIAMSIDPAAVDNLAAGDMAEFHVSLTNKVAGSKSGDVVVKGTLPKGLTFARVEETPDEKALLVTNVSNSAEATTKIAVNSFEVTFSSIAFGDHPQITFIAMADGTQAGAGEVSVSAIPGVGTGSEVKASVQMVSSGGGEPDNPSGGDETPGGGSGEEPGGGSGSATLPSDRPSGATDSRESLSELVTWAEQIERGEWSEESWQSFQEALQAARDALDGADESVFAQVGDALNAAVDGLTVDSGGSGDVPAAAGLVLSLDPAEVSVTRSTEAQVTLHVENSGESDFGAFTLSVAAESPLEAVFKEEQAAEKAVEGLAAGESLDMAVVCHLGEGADFQPGDISAVRVRALGDDGSDVADSAVAQVTLIDETAGGSGSGGVDVGDGSGSGSVGDGTQIGGSGNQSQGTGTGSGSGSVNQTQTSDGTSSGTVTNKVGSKLPDTGVMALGVINLGGAAIFGGWYGIRRLLQWKREQEEEETED